MALLPQLSSSILLTSLLAIIITHLHVVTAQVGTSSSISGYAFFDSSRDGTLDTSNTLDYGIYDISVWLFDCNNDILKTTKTDTAGYYSFEGLSSKLAVNGEGYYINAKIPNWYVISDIWNGKTNDDGELMYETVDNAVNPTTGRSACFELQDGEVKDVSFGLNFYIPPVDPPLSTPSPTVVASVMETDAPTMDPTNYNWGGSPPTQSPIIKPDELIPTTAAPTSNAPTTLSPTTDEPTISPTDPTKETDSPITTISPSKSPTFKPSPIPTLSPIIDNITNAPSSSQPTSTPSNSPTFTSTPTSFPTFPPTRSGIEYGPIETERLQMTIRGIDTLENEDEWSILTKEHVECYFNKCYEEDDEKGVWNVNVDVAVIQIISSSSSVGERSGFTRYLPWKKKKQDMARVVVQGQELGGEEEEEGRELQQSNSNEAKYIQIIYNQRSTYTTSDQRSTYTTSDPMIYDDLYVATDPFATQTSQEQYKASLQQMSTFYDNVISVGSIRVIPKDENDVDEPIPQPESVESGDNKSSEEGGSNNSTMIYAIVGVVCGTAIIVASAVLIYYRRKNDPNNAQYAHSVGNGPQSSMRQFDYEANNGDLESQQKKNDDGATHEGGYSSPSKRHVFDDSAFETIPENAAISPRSGSSRSEKMLQIIAPPGKLGVVVDTPPGGGCAYVCEIKATSPIKNEIQLEDRIIAVDVDDVQKMSAVDVSKLLAKRSRNAERKITVLRRVKDPTDAAVADSSSMLSTASSLLPAAAAAAASSSSAAATSTSDNETLMHIIAPEGKLGVVLVTPEPPETGPAYVFKIRDDSPLVGKLLLNDKVIAVDDEDVTKMSAINVSKLLGSKSSAESRKISVLRSVAGGANGSTTSSSMKAMTSNPESNAEIEVSAVGGGTGTYLEIIAPPGKLGVVVDSPPEGGKPAYVSDIKQECPIKTRIKLGDKIMKVDDEDVSSMKAIHVSMLLGSKSRNDERKLTVLRESA